MSFKENLDKMPDIAHLSGLDIIDSEGRVATTFLPQKANWAA